MSDADFRRAYEIPPGAVERAKQQLAELSPGQSQAHRSIVALEADGETVCRSCGVPLIWALGYGGGAVPITSEPDPEGTVGVNQHGEWVFGLPRQLAGQQSLLEEGGQPRRWRLHFETCPDRARWHRWGLLKRQREKAGDQ